MNGQNDSQQRVQLTPDEGVDISTIVLQAAERQYGTRLDVSEKELTYAVKVATFSHPLVSVTRGEVVGNREFTKNYLNLHLVMSITEEMLREDEEGLKRSIGSNELSKASVAENETKPVPDSLDTSSPRGVRWTSSPVNSSLGISSIDHRWLTETYGLLLKVSQGLSEIEKEARTAWILTDLREARAILEGIQYSISRLISPSTDTAKSRGSSTVGSHGKP